jgi:cytosine deaminase
LNSLHFSAEDKKGGAVINGVKFFEQKTCHHKIDIYNGEHKEISSKLLQNFFKSKR